MLDHQNEFTFLASRVRQGEPGCAEDFRSRCEPEVLRRVRQTLRTGTADTPFKRRILRTAQTMIGDPRREPVASREDLIQRVADVLCAAHVDQLVRSCPTPQRMRETVLA